MSARTNMLGAFSLLLMATGMLLEAIEDGLKGSAVMVGVPPEWTSGANWMSAASTGFFLSAGLLGTVREIDLLFNSQRLEKRMPFANGFGALAPAIATSGFEFRDETSFEMIAEGLNRIRQGLRMAWSEVTGTYVSE